jgi:hypothetical protein
MVRRNDEESRTTPVLGDLKSCLAFDDSERDKLRHLAGDTGFMHHIHHPVDILIGLRGLLGQAGHTAGSHLDAVVLQILAQFDAFKPFTCLASA